MKHLFFLPPWKSHLGFIIPMRNWNRIWKSQIQSSICWIYNTYEELKPSFVSYCFFSILGIYNTYEELKPAVSGLRFIIPMRNWNTCKHLHYIGYTPRIYNTYEELKLVVSFPTGIRKIWIYNTYEELKLEIYVIITEEELRFIIPMRNWNFF
mgnify:CR=1 FL=1